MIHAVLVCCLELIEVTMSFGDAVASQELEDPSGSPHDFLGELGRSCFASGGLQGIEAIEADLDAAVQKLARANQNIESLQKLLKTEAYKNDSTLADTVKATAKALEEVRHGIFGKKETKGYFEQLKYGRTNGAAHCAVVELTARMGEQRTKLVQQPQEAHGRGDCFSQ